MASLKTVENWFQYHLSLNAGEKYCRMLQREHSALLLTFIRLPFVINIFVLSFLSGRFTQVLLYIQMHSRKFSVEANTMNPDRAATRGK